MQIIKSLSNLHEETSYSKNLFMFLHVSSYFFIFLHVSSFFIQPGVEPRI